jgi:hypothetical protein
MMHEFRLKNVTHGYKPPKTWEEFKALDRPARIIAARHFVRQAAIRLQTFGLCPDDIINAFDAIPEWISHQLHAYKREQAELRKVWVCNACGHKAQKHEFFKERDQMTFLVEKTMAVCPNKKCGMTNAEEYVPPPPEEEQMPGVEPAPLGEVKKLPSKPPLEKPEFSFIGVDVPAQPEEPCDDCEGHRCPVCDGMGEDGFFKNHRCDRCGTELCVVCHGIKKAQLSRAYDEIRRCRC